MLVYVKYCVLSRTRACSTMKLYEMLHEGPCLCMDFYVKAAMVLHEAPFHFTKLHATPRCLVDHAVELHVTACKATWGGFS